MANRKLVGELVELYYELDDTISTMEGSLSGENITELRNLQIKLDKLLTNISKRWAKGKRARGYVPVKLIKEEDYTTHIPVKFV